MNILFLGIGSIGQRHIRNIKAKYKKVNFYTIRDKFSVPLLNNLNKPIHGNIKSKYNLQRIKLSDVNRGIKIDTAFICLPNHLHAKFFKYLINRRVNIFLEKPAGVNYKDLELYKSLQKKILKEEHILYPKAIKKILINH